MPGPQIGLQLYTLRDLTKEDFPGTLTKVKEIGYDYAELAGYGNLKTAKEAKKALDDAGVKVCGMHTPIKDLEGNMAGVVSDAQTLDTKLVVCPHLSENERNSADAWKNVADRLSKVGRALHEHGIELAYHNHSFEFQKFDGKFGYDIFFDAAKPHLVFAEIDVYWVKHGGEDPVAYINKLGERVVSLHLKDMNNADEKKFAPVGTGILDFKAILDAATKVGVKWGIVEQDQCYGADPLESIKTSRENLTKLGF